jgi:phytoene dehydrogenase-like protein
MERRDAIIIGAGLNGLVAGAYLARAGMKVLVLERADRPGGVEATHEFATGFHAHRFLLRASALNPKIVAELDLVSHGLRQFHLDAGVSLFSDGTSLAHCSDRAVLTRELARFSPRDADAFIRFRRDMSRSAQSLATSLEKAMPEIASWGLAALRRRHSWIDDMAEKSLSELYEIARLWSASSEELLGDYFESDIIHAHYAAASLAGATWGPRSATSGFGLLTPFLNDREASVGGDPRMTGVLSGPGSTIAALLSCIKAHGGALRCEAEVTDVVLKGGRASAVVLADGEEIPADTILSDLDAKRTFLSLFPWKDLPGDFVERVARLRMKGVTAKVNLALDSAPHFPDVSEGCLALRGGIRLVRNMSQMDSAYDDWRNGVLPSVPLIFADVPTWRDPSLAPHGQHILSVLVQYVPMKLQGADWTGEERISFADRVVTQLESHCPGLKDHILAREVWLSADMETEIGQTQGDLSQGEASLDQMFFNRPLAGTGSSRTPIRNFHLCSASAHPGPLVAGGAGANAARDVITLRRGGAPDE